MMYQLNNNYNFKKAGTIIMPFLQIRKLKHREISTYSMYVILARMEMVSEGSLAQS